MKNGKRRRFLKIYLHPNTDGCNAELVAAYTQKEACMYFQDTVGGFQRFGGQCVKPEEDRFERLKFCLKTPGKVYYRRLGVYPEPAWGSVRYTRFNWQPPIEAKK